MSFSNISFSSYISAQLKENTFPETEAEEEFD